MGLWCRGLCLLLRLSGLYVRMSTALDVFESRFGEFRSGSGDLAGAAEPEAEVEAEIKGAMADRGRMPKLGDCILSAHNSTYRTPPPVLLLVTPIDISTHAVTHFGSRPFTSFVQSFDTWYSDKRLADRFTGFRVIRDNPSFNPPY